MWERVDDTAVDRIIGSDSAAYLWDTSLGARLPITPVDADRAVSVLEDPSGYSVVSTFEGPISREDDARCWRIRDAIDVPITHHFRYEGPLVSLADGANKARRLAGMLATVEKPMCYQLFGTGITGAWWVHVAAVIEADHLYGINCHELF